MKKFILITLACSGIFAIAGCTTSTTESDCSEVCNNVVAVCDSYSQLSCNEACIDRSKQQKECAKNATSCIDIEQGCQSPKETEGKNCSAACNNYVAQCISLVPNATEELRKDAYNSCSDECKGRATEKTSCIEKSTDCPMMTETCGL